jgi:hypothetical protein
MKLWPGPRYGSNLEYGHIYILSMLSAMCIEGKIRRIEVWGASSMPGLKAAVEASEEVHGYEIGRANIK